MMKIGWKQARGLGLAGVLLVGCIGEEPTVPTFPECAVGATLCGETCVSTLYDALHCGSCDVACDISAGEVCSYGLCTCSEELLTCDDGCFDALNDSLHCGDCETACDTASGEVCNDGECTLVCGGGTERCGDACVSTQLDPAHCGDCETACRAGEVCSKGKCALSCAGGTTKCGASCVDTDHDPKHCGDCSTSCDTAAGSTCVDGECTPTCSGGTTSCDDRCVDLDADEAHCGDCDTRCDELASCEGGTCRCPDGYSGNGESCRDIDECEEDNPCSPSGECINVDGSYVCRCHDGQTGDGVTCTGFDLVTENIAGQGGGSVFEFAISADGERVAFTSTAPIVETPATETQTYVRDIPRHSSLRASVNAAGAPAEFETIGRIALSADGNLVAFVTASGNLGSGDGDGADYDVFVRDIGASETNVASETSDEDIAFLGGVGLPAFSDDARYLVFQCLVPSDEFVEAMRWGIYRVKLGTTEAEIVDVNDEGQEPDSPGCDQEGATNDSDTPAISGDGSVIAFQNPGHGLADGDDNCERDVYVRDLSDPENPITTLVSATSDGYACTSPSKQGSTWPTLSADGTLVAFDSDCRDLTGTDTKNYRDVFVRDLVKGTIRKVSVDLSGGESDSNSYRPTISADGRYVAFASDASDLVSGDGNNSTDIFVRDLQAGTTTRVSLDDDGGELVDGAGEYAFARGGGAIVFKTAAKLSSPDTNTGLDLYLRYLR